jgi:hypothetical protein
MSESEDEEIFDDEEMSDSDDANSGSIKDEELGSEFDDHNDDGSMMKSPKEGKSGEDGEEENADEIDPSYS